MKNLITLGGVSFVVALVAVVAVPAHSFAANYAYVNTSGDVALFVANNADEALRNAPNMNMHSGVILLDSADDTALVGTSL